MWLLMKAFITKQILILLIINYMFCIQSNYVITSIQNNKAQANKIKKDVNNRQHIQLTHITDKFKIILFPKNNYKLTQIQMNKQKITNGILFQPIGISDNLKPVNCYITKPITNNYHNNMQYTNQKTNSNNQKWASQNNNKQQMYNRDIKDRNRYNDNVHNQQKQYYWPADIIQDQTGNTLKQLKTYLQSHKINSYIKLNLQANNKNNKPILNKKQLIDNIQIKNEKNSIITLNQYMGNDGQYQATYNRRNNNKQRVRQNNQSTAKNKYYGKQQIESERHSQKSKQSTRKCIKIDYQQITVGRSISSSMLRDKNKQTFCLDNRHRTASIKNGQNKIYIQTYVTQFNPHDKSSSYSKKSQRSAQFQKYYPSVDQNDKKRLTPNTSTHFHTIQSADIRQSDNYQNRNRKQSTNTNRDKYVNKVKHTGIINQDQQYENNHTNRHAYNTDSYSDQSQQNQKLKKQSTKRRQK